MQETKANEIHLVYIVPRNGKQYHQVRVLDEAGPGLYLMFLLCPTLPPRCRRAMAILISTVTSCKPSLLCCLLSAIFTHMTLFC